MAFNTEEFIQGLAKILQVPPDTIHTGTVLTDHATWDSVGVMEFILFVDEHFGISLPPYQIGTCSTLGDLLELCRSHVPN
jgi:acyl carrier protein